MNSLTQLEIVTSWRCRAGIAVDASGEASFCCLWREWSIKLYIFRRIVHYSSGNVADTIGIREVKAQPVMPGILMLKCIIDRRQKRHIDFIFM